MKKIMKQLGIKIREASNRDFFDIKEIAKSSFIGFRNWRRLPSTVHYQLDYPMRTSYGKMNVAVAENKYGNISSYIYYQYRTNNEMYLVELAARPPKTEDRVPLSGTALLRYALNETIKNGYERGTLNVVNDQRNIMKENGEIEDVLRNLKNGQEKEQEKEFISLAKLVSFYSKFGYQEQKNEVGYTSDGGNRYFGDIWMVSSDLKDSLLKINKYLEKHI